MSMIRRKSKPALEPTVIDGLIIAISPALIIGMIASLVFFLVIAFYRGQYDARLMYILGLFTLATVLIARIAIDNGRAYANAFSIPLAIAAMLAMLRFVTVSGPFGPFSWIINMGLLGIAWYLADRITFDCTHVDDREESLQQGLLQSLKLVAHADPTQPAVAKQSVRRQPALKSKRRHNPGVWVLYFALLALPLFGLGQLTIPDPTARNQAFKYLIGYLACALGLLLTTSFVGMRRYARQRGIEMPSELNRVWLGMGAAGIAAVLILSFVLPLPAENGLRLAWLPVEFTAPAGLQTSKWGWGQSGQPKNQASEAATNGPNSSSEASPASGSPQADGKGPPQAADNAAADAPQRGSESGNQSQQESASTADQGDRSGRARNEQQSSANRDAQVPDQKSEAAQPASDSSKQPDGNNQRDRNSSAEPPDAQTAASENQPRQSTRPNSQPNSSQQSTEKTPEKSTENNTEKNAEQPKSDPQADNAEPSRAKNSSPTSKVAPPSRSSSSHWLSNLNGSFFKWLVILVLASIVLFYAITHPRELAKLWQEFTNFFANLFGRNSSRQFVAEDRALVATEGTVRRPFSTFVDPFASSNTKFSPQQIIEHTFTALEAWGAERGRVRADAQTAEEFANQLARHQPQLGTMANTAAQMLDRVMFASWRPTLRDIAPLAKLWQLLRES